MLHLLAQAVEREFAALQGHFEEQLARWQTDTETLQADLIQELDHLRAHSRQQAAQLQEKDAQLEVLIEERHALQAQLKAAEQAGREQAQRYQSALGEGAQLRKALTEAEHRQLALTRDHQAEMADLKSEQQQLRQELIAQHDKETARLQTQLGNERGEWKQARNGLEQELKALRLECAMLKEQARALRSEVNQQNTLVQAQVEELDDLRHQLSTQAEEVRELRQQSQKTIRLEATLQQQTGQIQQQAKEIERLRRHTDTAADSRLTAILERLNALQPKQE